MSKMPIGLQRSVLEKVVKEKGLAIDLINWDRLDPSLSYDENQAVIMEEVQKLQKPTETVEPNEAEKEEFIKKVNKIEEAVAQEEFDKALQIIKDTPTPNIDKHFAVPIQLIKSVHESKEVHSLIFDGDAGLGKTYTTVKTLLSMDMKNKKDFKILRGHLTPMELYHLMWKFQHATIVLDDPSELLENPTSKRLLMSASWSPTNVRIVEWLSSTSKLSAPQEFEFKGKIIFCVNTLPKELEPLKSRSHYFYFNFPWNERLAIAYKIAKVREIPFEIIDWIKTNKIYNFDFRLPTKLHSLGDDWEKLAPKVVEIDETLIKMFQLIRSTKSVSKQIEEWKKETGMRRASFFNYRKRFFPDYKKYRR